MADKKSVTTKAVDKYHWPSRAQTHLLGKEHPRLDGLTKSTGTAKYTADVNLKGQLIVRALGCPHAHCRVLSVDVRAAEKVPGVVHVHLIRAPKKDKQGKEIQPEIQTQGELIAAVAAESEGAAAEGVAQLRVEYEPLDVFVGDDDLAGAKALGRTKKAGGRVDLEKEPDDDQDEEAFENQEIARLLAESAYTVEGHYGIEAVTHCCLEPHGTTLQWKGDRLDAWLSTQNVSGTDDGFAAALELTADDVDVQCEYIGGGFGSKFNPGYWSVAAAQIAKATGRPVKFMLERDQELKIAGNRPSGFIQVKLGADPQGVVRVWDSHHWGTSGYNGGTVSIKAIPYVFRPKNSRRRATGIRTNNTPSVAWRAPNHPQACLLTQAAFDDLAAKMGADSYDIFWRNLVHIASQQKADVYREEMKIAARLMDWRDKWHPHGKGPRDGPVVEGLGLGLHTWGGGANRSTCQLKIYPDGGVESFCGTQDLGTGTRTVCALVLAETLGLPISGVKVHIGHSTYPFSGASGGSTTVGAVSESHRRAATDALAKLFELVAGKLDADPRTLVAADGRIHVRDHADRSMAWQEVCGLLGVQPLEVTASHRGGPSELSDAGVGGVQMAQVAVDTETGVVQVKKLVAVQDMGMIVNRTTARSQVHGAMMMEIAYALFEQRINDPQTGAFLNAELADYRLPHLGDIGEIMVHLYEPDGQRARGVIGLGEPPVISGGAAIANAVCNATGVRIPVLPLTPKRVLDTIRTARTSA